MYHYFIRKPGIRRFVPGLWLAAMLGGCATSGVDSTAPVVAADKTERIEKPVVSRAATERFARAIEALSRAELGMAEEQLVTMIDRYPDLASPVINLGIIYRRTGRAELARQMFQRARQLSPRDCTPLIQLGLLEREQLNIAAAETAYQACIEINPNDEDALLNLGILNELYLGQWREAISDYKRYQLLADEPDVQPWIADLERRAPFIAGDIR